MTSPSTAIDFEQVINGAYKRRGTVTVLIAGKTGVGKSTLINAVFQGDIAKTGAGRPVTEETREYSKEGIPLRILDTVGLEMGKKRFEQTYGQLRSLIRDRQQRTDANEHVHVAWICIAEPSSRVEEIETQLSEMMHELGVPVIAVLTKTRGDEAFQSQAQKLMPRAANVVPVRALEERVPVGGGLEPVVLPPVGLRDLVELTMELVPKGQQAAFAAAQKVRIDLKVKAARGVMTGAAAAAAAAGAAPIPFADAFALVPIQVGMMAGISAAFGLDMGQGFLGTVASTAVGSLGATVAGRTAVTTLLKFIPGAGSLIGGSIAAATAAALTTAIGAAYIEALRRLFVESPEGDISAERVSAAFSQTIKLQSV